MLQHLRSLSALKKSKNIAGFVKGKLKRSLPVGPSKNASIEKPEKITLNGELLVKLSGFLQTGRKYGLEVSLTQIKNLDKPRAVTGFRYNI